MNWNAVYIERAVTHLRECIPRLWMLPNHVSPLSSEQINLTGIYTWDTEHEVPEGFRSLDPGSVTPRRTTFMLRSILACRWEQFLFRPVMGEKLHLRSILRVQLGAVPIAG
nr:hypothetical protein [Mesorhizobium ciceri]